jgi:cytochrome P450
MATFVEQKGPVVDFDCYDVEPVGGDVQLGWKRLHDGPDIFWTPRNGGHWIFTRADDIYEAYRNDAVFSSEFVAVPKEEARMMKFAPAEYDKPDHSKYRLVIAPLFTPLAVKRLEERAEELSRTLIERVHAAGQCDFIPAFADQLPIAIFLSMMDLPIEDHALLAPHVEAMTRNPDPAAIGTAFQTMIGYLAEKVDARQGKGGDDAISRMLAARVGDRPVTREEVLSLAANVMFAGLDTVVSGMGFVMRFLAMNPDHRRRLVDAPEDIPEALEEILRRHGIANLARMVRERTVYKDVVLEAGDMIQLPTALHGLDERRFVEAHMVFAVGPHRCLGSHLARMELRVMLREWLPRIPDFRIADTAGVVARSGRINAIKALPLVWS